MSPGLTLAVEAVRELVAIIDEAIRANVTHEEIVRELKAHSDKFATAINSLDKAISSRDSRIDREIDEKFK